VTIHAVGEKTQVKLELTAQEAEGIRKLSAASLDVPYAGTTNPYVIARWADGKILHSEF
jgi:hypothetical protein